MNTLLKKTYPENILKPYWRTNIIERDPIYFVQEGDRSPIRGRLLFTPERMMKAENRTIPGWVPPQGVEDLPNLLVKKPDLIIVAYGMNDISENKPENFRHSIKSIIDQINQTLPNSEVILVSPMLGNREWHHNPRERFPIFREVIRSFEKIGVGFADMTSLWEFLDQHKAFHDLIGNGVNHPNDFGHILYAQTILGLLVEEKKFLSI